MSLERQKQVIRRKTGAPKPSLLSSTKKTASAKNITPTKKAAARSARNAKKSSCNNCSRAKRS